MTGLYVEALVRADPDDLWDRTQQPARHRCLRRPRGRARTAPPALLATLPAPAVTAVTAVTATNAAAVTVPEPS